MEANVPRFAFVVYGVDMMVMLLICNGLLAFLNLHLRFLISGSSSASGAAPSGQCEGVCALSGIPRHVPLLWKHLGQTQTGKSRTQCNASRKENGQSFSFLFWSLAKGKQNVFIVVFLFYICFYSCGFIFAFSRHNSDLFET